MSDTTFFDVRAAVMNGDVKVRNEAIFVDRLGGWLNIQELYADKKSMVLQSAVNQKSGKVDLNVLYAGLSVLSLRYPAPGVTPKAPVLPETLPATASEEDKAKYEQEMNTYKAAVALLQSYKDTYPGYADEQDNVKVFAHPKAGEQIFGWVDRDMFATKLPGGILEEVATPAFALSGFSQEDLDEKKVSSAPTVVSSTTTPSPTSSDGQTLTSSSAN